MDFTDALKAGGASATIIAIVAIVYKITSAFCGHRIRSECCGHTGTVGVTTEQMVQQKTQAEQKEEKEEKEKKEATSL